VRYVETDSNAEAVDVRVAGNGTGHYCVGVIIVAKVRTVLTDYRGCHCRFMDPASSGR
jgi:hypothetical protein